MKTIKTQNLIVRSLDVSDVSDKYVDWLNDIEVNRFLDLSPEKQTRKICEDFVYKMSEDVNEELFGIFTIDRVHIGNCKLGNINRKHGTAEVSFFIGDKTCWGLGYATEVLLSIIQYGFTNLNLDKITAGCCEFNFGSLKVLIKSGMQIEGFLRKQVQVAGKRQGVYRLGVLKNDYK